MMSDCSLAFQQARSWRLGGRFGCNFSSFGSYRFFCAKSVLLQFILGGSRFGRFYVKAVITLLPHFIVTFDIGTYLTR
jgi:hypothetical protein